MDGGKPTVLVVDDEKDVRDWLRLDFELYGWTVYDAEDGFKALECWSELHPDIALLDEMMPGMTGLETARRIRESQPDAHLLMFSASVDKNVRAEAERIGVQFISKVDHQALVRYMEALHAELSAQE